MEHQSMAPPRDEQARQPEKLAIVGIGCRLPGGVHDLESLGRVLDSSCDVFTEIPRDRWDHQAVSTGYHGPGSAPGGVGAFLDEVDRFDAEFFGISPASADALDPQQRLLLEVGWEAMADSGYPRAAWRGSRTGVFVGMLVPDYTVLHAKTL